MLAEVRIEDYLPRDIHPIVKFVSSVTLLKEVSISPHSHPSLSIIYLRRDMGAI
jgi:hypothetical protein